MIQPRWPQPDALVEPPPSQTPRLGRFPSCVTASSACRCAHGGYGSWPFHSHASCPPRHGSSLLWGRGPPSVDGAAGLGAGGRRRPPRGCRPPRRRAGSRAEQVQRLPSLTLPPMTAARRAARTDAPPPSSAQQTRGTAEPSLRSRIQADAALGPFPIGSLHLLKAPACQRSS